MGQAISLPPLKNLFVSSKPAFVKIVRVDYLRLLNPTKANKINNSHHTLLPDFVSSIVAFSVLGVCVSIGFSTSLGIGSGYIVDFSQSSKAASRV
jgi:hypothetical protein